jgi:threonine dehydratase
MTIPTVDAIEAARAKLRPFLPITPLTKAEGISEIYGRNVLFKWDNKFRTGSFKERGALHFLLNLSPEQLSRGICAASAGNHALALSFHAHRLKVPCYLIMPTSAPLVKVESCRALGAVISHEPTFDDCLRAAIALSTANGYTFIPPYDHHLIIEGQGVAGLELLEQSADFDSIIIPIGGGGYAAGVATAVKARRPDVYILGVCSEWATTMRKEVSQGPRAFIPMTIADGIAVKSLGSITRPIIDKLVDQVVAVSEEAIARAIIGVLEHEHVVIEGAAAAAFAGLMEGHLPKRYSRPVLFACGSNIDTNILTRLIEHGMVERGRLCRVRVTLPDRPGMLHLLSGIIAAEGANVLQVQHDRFYAKAPGHVEITIMMEVRDTLHADAVVRKLSEGGVPSERL